MLCIISGLTLYSPWLERSLFDSEPSLKVIPGIGDLPAPVSSITFSTAIMQPFYSNCHSLPCESCAFSHFLSSYPSYRKTKVIDSLRHEEYPHLDINGQVCLDYTGVGLFSSLQRCFGDGSSIGMSYTSANLATHAMYAEEGSTESFFRKRVLKHLNLNEKDYYIVFTANSFSAFKLLGEAYPFHEAQNLLLAYDHQCENINGIVDCAHAKGATIQSTCLCSPELRIDSVDLTNKLQGRKKCCNQKQETIKGLFAYRHTSGVTGCRNSTQWIKDAQQNGWHVLLEVSSVDVKMLDAFPEFIICSFYNVFGQDPTGFGCLLIRNSVLRSLGDSSRARAVGMVTLVTRHGSSPNSPDTSVSVFCQNTSMSQHSNGACDHWSHSSTLLHGLLSQGKWHAETVASNNMADSRVKQGSEPSSIKGCNGVAPYYDNMFLYSLEIDSGISQEKRSSLYREKCRAPHKLSTYSYQGLADIHSDVDYGPSTSQNLSLHYDGITTRRSSDGQSTTQLKGVPIPFLQTEISRCKCNVKSSDPGISLHTQRRRNVKGLFYGYGVLFEFPDKNISTDGETSQVEGFRKITGDACPADNLKKEDFNDFCTVRTASDPSNQSRLDFDDPKGSLISAMSKDIKVATKFIEAPHICKGLDHVDMLGWKLLDVRLRSLTSWLVSALLRLRHSNSEDKKLVRIYSPISQADCSSTIAFTLSDTTGNLFDPKRVQRLADRCNISLRIGLIQGPLSTEQLEHDDDCQLEFLMTCVELAANKLRLKGDIIHMVEVPVVYATLGFLNNFSDVYRLWLFVSQFLDPEFVEHEFWHYRALNQQKIEL